MENNLIRCKDCERVQNLVLSIIEKNIKSNNRRKRSQYKEFRKNYCEKCGYTKNIQVLNVHHKDFNYKNNEQKNLITLCSNCHNEIHRCLD